MEKSIVEVVSNNKGEVIEKVADYIGIEEFAKSIEELYRECLDNFDNKEELEQYINDLYDDENHIHNLAWEFAHEVNRDMKKYLHMDSHRMDGNFADIENDYFDLFPEMVKRLDAAEDSERANDDREYLSSWYFYAFGTFGIKYNFSNELQDLSYDLEREEEFAPTA